VETEEKNEESGVPVFLSRACSDDFSSSHESPPLKSSTIFQLQHPGTTFSAHGLKWGNIQDPNYSKRCCLTVVPRGGATEILEINGFIMTNIGPSTYQVSGLQNCCILLSSLPKQMLPITRLI
jgi:hypothetical protein